MLTQKYVLRILVDASARYKDGSIKLDKDGNELRGQVNMFLSQKYEDGLSATKREAHVFTSLREAIRARARLVRCWCSLMTRRLVLVMPSCHDELK